MPIFLYLCAKVEFLIKSIMCLVTEQMKPYVATHDITVCKVLVLWPDGSLKTPYQRCPIQSMPMLIKGKGRTKSIQREVLNGGRMIEEGYIHSYFDLTDAIMSGLFFATDLTRVCLVRAIIPAGTEYFIGRDDDICSETLLLKDIVYVIDKPDIEKLNDLEISMREKLSLHYRHSVNPMLYLTSASPGFDKRCLTYLNKKVNILEMKLDYLEKTYKIDYRLSNIEDGVDLILTTLMINGVTYKVPTKYI